MTYEQYEDAIVGLLSIPGVSVSVLPHEAALVEMRATARPQLYVIINGSNFGEPESMGMTAQRETLQCEIFIRAKARRGRLGIFDLYGKISERLLGRKLPDAVTPIAFDQFGYVAGIQNNWQYALTFSFDTYRVEADPDAAEAVGRIKRITIQTNEP
ncbi:MAG: hypothetical protein J1E79_01780 [Rikenella sp.]|nr:hypothetical protein [Rikenella sp.]